MFKIYNTDRGKFDQFQNEYVNTICKIIDEFRKNTILKRHFLNCIEWDYRTIKKYCEMFAKRKRFSLRIFS